MGNINRTRFEQWVEDKLVPVLGDYSLRQPRSLVVMDNATIHHSDRIVNLIEDTGARVVYLPPYSPDLNPIELMFAAYKRKLQRLGRNLDWVESHYTALVESVSRESARNYYRHCIEGANFEDDDDDIDDLIVIIIALLLRFQTREG